MILRDHFKVNLIPYNPTEYIQASIEAVYETFMAFALPAGAGRGGFLINAVFSLLLGVMILAQWPVSSVWAIGTMVGVAVLVNGVTRAVISGQIRQDVRALGRAAAAA